MRYRRLDLNLLVALDALLSEKSVTRAALRLHITQPAMSGLLARLRDYFQDALIVQVGRQVELTLLAESLVAPVQDILLRVDVIIAADPGFDPKRSKRHFSMTVSDYVLRIFLLDALQRVYREAPGITFEFRQPGSRTCEELESGEIDFVIGPEIDILPEHPHEALFEDTYTVIAWAGSRAVADTLSLDAYMGLGHVVFRGDQRGSPWLERWFERQYGDGRRIEMAVASFSLLPHAIVGTDRIATVQARLAQHYVQSLPLKLIQAPMELPKLTEVLQWNVQRDRDPTIRWLLGKLKDMRPSMAAAA